METERIELSARERERLKVLQQVEEGHIQQVEAARRAEYIEVQKILADELPSIPLWYPDNQVVHTQSLHGMVSQSDGTFDFLR